MKVFERGLEEGLLLRLAGDAIAVGPPFISTADELTQMGEGIRRAIRHVFQQGKAPDGATRATASAPAG